MPHPFHTAELLGEDVLQALPLVQVTWPTVTADTWLRYVRFVVRRSGKENAGVVTIRDGSGYICGMLVYETDCELSQDWVLTVRVFTAVDLANSTQIVRRLLKAARLKAVGLGCAAVRIRIDDAQSVLGAQVRTLGFVQTAEYLWGPAEIAA